MANVTEFASREEIIQQTVQDYTQKVLKITPPKEGEDPQVIEAQIKEACENDINSYLQHNPEINNGNIRTKLKAAVDKLISNLEAYNTHLNFDLGGLWPKEKAFNIDEFLGEMHKTIEGYTVEEHVEDLSIMAHTFSDSAYVIFDELIKKLEYPKQDRYEGLQAETLIAHLDDFFKDFEQRILLPYLNGEAPQVPLPQPQKTLLKVIK